MRSIDLAIIYLACGAPIAAEYALRSGMSLTFATASKVLLHLFVWPIYAFQLIFNFFDARRRSIAEKTSVRHHLESIRSSIEAELAYGSRTVATFNFRELFDRYTGLTIDASIPEIDTGVAELLQLGEHPNVALAKNCIQRRNLAVLQEHSKAATIEFRDFIRARAESANNAITNLAVQAAELVCDDPTAAAMTFTREALPNRSVATIRETFASTN